MPLIYRDTPTVSGSALKLVIPPPNQMSLVQTNGINATDVDAADVNKPRALLVDDTPSNTKMLKMLLQREGLVCDEAANGAIAVEMVRKTTRDRLLGAASAGYNIVFMDCNMPVMDGLTATRTLRATLHFDSLVVGCSGNANDQEVDEFIEAGADFVMPKPMRFDELQRLLDYAERVDFASIPNTQLQLTDSPHVSCKVTSKGLQRLKAVPRARGGSV